MFSSSVSESRKNSWNDRRPTLDVYKRQIATHEVDDLNMEDPYSFSHRTWELEYQRKQELQKNILFNPGKNRTTQNYNV